MMVEKENLATEEVTVTIEVTNAAGLVNRQNMKVRDSPKKGIVTFFTLFSTCAKTAIHLSNTSLQE